MTSGGAGRSTNRPDIVDPAAQGDAVDLRPCVHDATRTLDRERHPVQRTELRLEVLLLLLE
jgi:hypothetical protein